jgi:Glycosyltransferase 61
MIVPYLESKTGALKFVSNARWKIASNARILPIVARLQSKLIGRDPCSRCAAEIVELAPPVDRVHPAAIALPGEFNRVTGVHQETTVSQELERLAEGKRQHGPTIAYRIDDAVVGAGTVYYKGGYEVISGALTKPLLQRRRDHLKEAQLCSNYAIARYFGHWLADGLCLELLAEERMLPALTLTGVPWLHESGYRELCALKPTRSANARVDRLWLVDDRGFNDGWLSRFEALRRRIRSLANPSRARRVMLTRGDLGVRRNLVNAAEISEVLERLGFEIINPESETAQHLSETLSGAQIAVAVEGSAQHHCFVAMPPRSIFVAIQPPTRFGALGKTYADAVGIRWAYVVADPHAEGFQLPVARLLQTIDEVVRVTGIRI